MCLAPLWLEQLLPERSGMGFSNSCIVCSSRLSMLELVLIQQLKHLRVLSLQAVSKIGSSAHDLSLIAGLPMMSMIFPAKVRLLLLVCMCFLGSWDP